MVLWGAVKRNGVRWMVMWSAMECSDMSWSVLDCCVQSWEGKILDRTQVLTRRGDERLSGGSA